MRFIDVIGYSGSGKTYFIMKIIELLRFQLGFNIAVMKNVKQHQIDEEGKDSNIFTKSGANYSIIQNEKHEMAIFLKAEEITFDKLIKWLEQGPYKIDIVISEGFRNLNHPTVLCVSNRDEIKPQMTNNIKMISGIICTKSKVEDIPSNIPLINIDKEFEIFLKIFKIR